jgi:hypothetical protein
VVTLPLFPRGKTPRYALGSRLGGPQNQPERSGKQQNIDNFFKIKIAFSIDLSKLIINMCRKIFNIISLHIFPTQLIYEFPPILGTNNDRFPKQH